MTAPTQNWLDEAARADADPIFIFRLPNQNIYFASHPGHYPLDTTPGSAQPHHAGIVDKGGLPIVTRRIQNIFSGRSMTAVGNVKVIDNGSWDSYFGDYDNTLRGAPLDGYVTFSGISWADAVHYLSARIESVTTTDAGKMTLNLIDAKSAELAATKIVEGTYTAQTLGDVVRARLIEAGLVYPDDFDQAAWNAWNGAGKPGVFVVTGSWSEGNVTSVVDNLIAETLTWYSIQRDGTFYAEQFADLGGSPTVDIDLDGSNSLFDGGSTSTFPDVFRRQTVLYNAGASSVVKTVNLSTSHAWWPTAKEGESKDSGIDGVTDATYLCDARLALLSSEHLITTINADTRLLAFNLGDTVKLTLGGKNLPAVTPVYHRVIEIREDPNKGQAQIKLWTKLGGPPLV